MLHTRSPWSTKPLSEGDRIVITRGALVESEGTVEAVTTRGILVKLDFRTEPVWFERKYIKRVR